MRERVDRAGAVEQGHGGDEEPPDQHLRTIRAESLVHRLPAIFPSPNMPNPQMVGTRVSKRSTAVQGNLAKSPMLFRRGGKNFLELIQPIWAQRNPPWRTDACLRVYPE